MESFLTNKNFIFDFKTNLICDRIFYEENIMNDSKFQNIQISVLNLIDDFFFVTKTNSSFNKENIINQNKPKQNKDNNNLKINEENNSYQNEKTEENKVINNNKVQDDSNNISDVNKNSDKDNMDMDNKSLEEIYEYITKDNKVKNKKKNKRK